MSDASGYTFGGVTFGNSTTFTLPTVSVSLHTERPRTPMNVKPAAVRVRAGYLPQIYVDDQIAWEGRARKTYDKAMNAARARITEKTAEVFAA